MAAFGGFDHNEQTFRIVTLLERRYAAFDGLNLTWEALEGVVKHNGPLTGPHASAKAQARPVPQTISRYCEKWDLRDRRVRRARGAGRSDQRRHRLQQP